MIEPLTRARPPLARPAPGGAGLPVAYIFRDVLAEIQFNGQYHARQMAGGLLVGNHYQCPDSGRPYVEVEGFVAGVHVEGLADLLRYFRVQWKSAGLALRYNFPGAELVGWFAAVPPNGATVDPSAQDALLLHQTFFSHPWQVALSVAPEPEGPAAFVAGRGAEGAGPTLAAAGVGLIQSGRAR